MSIDPNIIINFIIYAYNFLVHLISEALQVSIFKADPQLAQEYAQLIGFLIPMTAIYIMLVFASSFKKIIGYAIAAGWGFIILMLILAKVG